MKVGDESETCGKTLCRIVFPAGYDRVVPVIRRLLLSKQQTRIGFAEQGNFKSRPAVSRTTVVSCTFSLASAIAPCFTLPYDTIFLSRRWRAGSGGMHIGRVPLVSRGHTLCGTRAQLHYHIILYYFLVHVTHPEKEPKTQNKAGARRKDIAVNQ